MERKGAFVLVLLLLFALLLSACGADQQEEGGGNKHQVGGDVAAAPGHAEPFAQRPLGANRGQIAHDEPPCFAVVAPAARSCPPPPG